MTTTRCHYVEGRGWYLPSHEPTCRDHDCDGCKPCRPEHGHCTARARCNSHLGHAQLTCPRCLRRTRSDIAEIERLADQLIDRAVDLGVDSEAADLAGPAADPEAWSWRRLAAWTAGADVTVLEDDDPYHPLAVLGRWDFMVREDYDLPTSLRCTVPRAADFLAGICDRLAQDPEQDFGLLAAEVRACRAHLEDVLADGIRDEKGAPCPVCAAQRHVTGPSSDESPLTGVAPGVEDSDRPAERHTAPRLVRRWAHHDPTGTSDTWRCPACHNTWTEAEYRLRISDDYLANADALTARDIEAQYGIKAGVLRKRAERDPRIRRGRNDSGQRLYDVRRVLAIGATTPEEMLESAVRLP